MRWVIPLLLLLVAGLAGPLKATESDGHRLWDGVQSVEEYAQQNRLKPIETLDLGNGVSMELRLIPAGRFLMGKAKPVPPGHTELFGQTILGAGALGLVALLFPLAVRLVRDRRRPQFSLMRFVLITLAASMGLLGALKWRVINTEWREYGMAVWRFENSSSSEKPAHAVTISRPFYMGTCPVTQAQFAAVMGKNPSLFKGQNLPVDSVTWIEVSDFCRKVCELTGREVCLPTEAQWEHACRAGSTATFCFGDSEADLDAYGWYEANSGGKTHPVGQKKPNAFGLFDTHGNVFQWCRDFDSFEYPGGPQVDPLNTVPADSYNRHVLRGGSWYSEPSSCRSVSRSSAEGDTSLEYFGFRMAMPIK